MAKEADQRRIDSALENLDTVPQRIEFLQREIARNRLLDQDGRWGHMGRDGKFHLGSAPSARQRGMNAKNIARVLRLGRKRLEKARADGVDFKVLPPDSKIRKRTEASWRNLIDPPLRAVHMTDAQGRMIIKYVPHTPSRGAAGREAARRVKPARTSAKRDRARELRAQGKSHLEIAAQLDCSERQVARYVNGR